MRRGLVISSLIAVAAAAPATSAAEDKPVPWLGILYRPSNSVGVPPGQRLEVEQIFPGTAAARAGVLAGDVIAAIDGKPLLNGPDLKAKIADQHVVGDRVRVTVERDGRLLDLVAPLGAKPSSSELLEQGVLGAPLPRMSVVDRHDGTPLVLNRQPAVLVVFDVGCEPCGGAASTIVAAAAGADPTIRVRPIIVGVEPAIDAYLSRNPIVGQVARAIPAEEGSTIALLAGLNPDPARPEGAVIVVDASGVVQFAASTIDVVDRPAVLAGALAAAARVHQRATRRTASR